MVFALVNADGNNDVIKHNPGDSGTFTISGKKQVSFEVISEEKALVTIPEGRSLFRGWFNPRLARAKFRRVIGNGQPIEIVKESIGVDWQGKGVHLRWSKER